MSDFDCERYIREQADIIEETIIDELVKDTERIHPFNKGDAELSRELIEGLFEHNSDIKEVLDITVGEIISDALDSYEEWLEGAEDEDDVEYIIDSYMYDETLDYFYGDVNDARVVSNISGLQFSSFFDYVCEYFIYIKGKKSWLTVITDICKTFGPNPPYIELYGTTIAQMISDDVKIDDIEYVLGYEEDVKRFISYSDTNIDEILDFVDKYGFGIVSSEQYMSNGNYAEVWGAALKCKDHKYYKWVLKPIGDEG